MKSMHVRLSELDKSPESSAQSGGEEIPTNIWMAHRLEAEEAVKRYYRPEAEAATLAFQIGYEVAKTVDYLSTHPPVVEGGLRNMDNKITSISVVTQAGASSHSVGFDDVHSITEEDFLIQGDPYMHYVGRDISGRILFKISGLAPVQVIYSKSK